MDVREKLVELIGSARYWGTSEEIADHLISNGVTVKELPQKEDNVGKGDIT